MIVPELDDQRVKAYLADLRRELRPVPRSRRREIVDEVRGHIAAEVAEASWPVETILARLGSPAEIAVTAMEDSPPPRQRVGWIEITTAVLLLVGGVVLPLVGWVIGIALLWTSNAWRLRDKLIGTLLVPGGLLGTVLAGVVSVFGVSSESGENCSAAVAIRADGSQRRLPQHCTDTASGGAFPTWVIVTLLVAIVVGPFFTFGWLLWQANREHPTRRESTFAMPLAADV